MLLYNANELTSYNLDSENVPKPFWIYIFISKLQKEWKLPGIDSFETELIEFLDAYFKVK
jgi:hypothetical protein